MENQQNIEIAVTTTVALSLVLTWIATLAAYTNATIVPNNKKMSFADRMLLVSKFNRVAVLICIFAYIEHYKLFNININIPGSSEIYQSISLFSFKNKELSWVTMILISVFILCMLKIIPFIVHSISPWFYGICSDIISNNIELIPILLIVWMGLWILRSMVELYIFVSDRLDSNYKPKYLPKFLVKWYDHIITRDGTKPRDIIGVYLRIILLDMIVILITWYFFIY